MSGRPRVSVKGSNLLLAVAAAAAAAHGELTNKEKAAMDRNVRDKLVACNLHNWFGQD